MNFGGHLREAREQRGVSLRQIAAATRISLRTLEALENNEIGKLPGGIFSRAFVRSYAHEVGLDPDETVREFVEQFPLDHVTAGSPSTIDGDVARGEEAVRRRQQFGLLLTLAIAVPIGAAVLYLLLSARRPASAADDSGETSSVPGSTPTASAPASPTTTTAGSPSVVPASGTSGAARVASPSPSASTPAPALSAAALAAPIGPNEALQLRIAPAGACWVRVRVNGAIQHQALMQKGDVYTVDSRDGFDLLIGDAGTFRFTINGRPGRSLGDSGEVAEARITRASVQNWLQRAR